MNDTVYNECQCFWVNSVYIIAIIIWFIIVFYFRLYNGSGAISLWIPIIVFLISFSNVEKLSKEVEDHMSRFNYLSIGLILSLRLLLWVSEDLKDDKQEFVTVSMIAMLFTVLTFIDIWLPPQYLPAYVHFQSCLQTMAISLLIYGFSTYLLNGGRGFIKFDNTKKLFF